MKKISIKNKKKTIQFFDNEKGLYVLKLILKNNNFLSAIQRNALLKLQNLEIKSSTSLLNQKCKLTFNTKKYNIYTKYSRHVFLKQLRFGKVYGYQKANW